jgi:hypothetical protein
VSDILIEGLSRFSSVVQTIAGKWREKVYLLLILDLGSRWG